ncbi:unnamed protein product, partial [Mesorhabditis belari]|uniref:Uncharacterized protein n=1 Tax=Mesorhabditis belari TaxID=2138241 RepID=A0AAF3EVN9_9BILA
MKILSFLCLAILGIKSSEVFFPIDIFARAQCNFLFIFDFSEYATENGFPATMQKKLAQTASNAYDQKQNLTEELKGVYNWWSIGANWANGPIPHEFFPYAAFSDNLMGATAPPFTFYEGFDILNTMLEVDRPMDTFFVIFSASPQEIIRSTTVKAQLHEKIIGVGLTGVNDLAEVSQISLSAGLDNNSFNITKAMLEICKDWHQTTTTMTTSTKAPSTTSTTKKTSVTTAERTVKSSTSQPNAVTPTEPEPTQNDSPSSTRLSIDSTTKG